MGSGPGHGAATPLLRAAPVVLSAGERTALNKRAPGSEDVSHRDRLRAQIVLAAARGRDNARIAADLRITVDTVRKWRGRFAGRGLDGWPTALLRRPSQVICSHRSSAQNARGEPPPGSRSRRSAP